MVGREAISGNVICSPSDVENTRLVMTDCVQRQRTMSHHVDASVKYKARGDNSVLGEKRIPRVRARTLIRSTT
jgi:hypothetical protein